MTSQTNEQAFESTVESMLVAGGWAAGDRDQWDVDRALFPARAIAFLRASQPESWEQLHEQHGDKLKTIIVDQLARQLDRKGTLFVLRQGIRFQGKTLQLAHFKPAHGLNPDAVALFELNELTVTRQVRIHPGKRETIDLLFALNGLPVATCELKNPMTGQTWRNAIRQYREARDPNAPVFKFSKRALVHFAADSDEVYMTTRLAKGDTRFLPFNRGSDPGGIECGAGNPAHPSGYPTSYFWQEVLERDRFLDILASYVFIERRDEKVYDHNGARTVKRETLIFPRYHQLDSVNKLVRTARSEGPGHNYLIQHSAGSGKTNSISWLSHRLASLHTADDDKVFDCVLVITDRRVLDRQLQDAVYQIEHAQGVVKAIQQDSKQLARALVDGTKIVITTLQKFPFVLQGLLSIAGAGSPDESAPGERAQAAEWQSQISKRRYAVIVDEAHSSQSGESAREMKAILGSRSQAAGENGDGTANEDWEDGLNAAVEARGPQPNLSFFAFTATPKGKTIELFGRTGPSGKPEPFHVYSMRQAIEEGFILDVLRNYTDYDTYFGILKKASKDPEFPKRRAAAALARFVTLHPYNIEQKTEVIIEHFRSRVLPLMGGRAKAMVVTPSRLHAVRYMQAFQRYVTDKGYANVRTLVAFSGTVHDPNSGEDFTEPTMNIDSVSGKPMSESMLPSRFASPDYQILIVAEKYQTGFDQPLLQAMYVDKRLDGVQAVQTLSRLNRIAPGKDEPFVLDFVNKPEEVGKAFSPFYDQTQLEAESDPDQLDALRHELDEMQVYYHSEVEAFAKLFFLPAGKRQPGNHALLNAQLQPARRRFGQLGEDEQTEFRSRLGAFVRLYAFLGQIIPYVDSDLERLSAFGRALLRCLPAGGESIDLQDDVALEYYRLQRVSSGAIDLDEDDDATVTSPTAVGTAGPEEPTAPLSEIIASLNERFGTEFTEAERLFLEQVKTDALGDENIRQTALANPLEKFSLGVRPQLIKLMLERMAGNDELVTRCLNDPDFQEIVFTGLLQEIFDAVATHHTPTT